MFRIPLRLYISEVASSSSIDFMHEVLLRCVTTTSVLVVHFGRLHSID